ncbi:hypothetical protein ACQZ4Q_01615 [Agrobacterium vitis]
MNCDECRRLLSEEYDSRSLARDIENAAPFCACQGISMSSISPGPVDDNEVLHRVMVSPRDYDPVTNLLSQKPFQKLFENGLSVMRDIGSNEDFLDIAEDSLLSTPTTSFRSVKFICSTTAQEIRGILGEGGRSAFCIYDQTVPRNIEGLQPVPTHAGIMQRQIAYDVPGAKKANKDLATIVFEKFRTAIQPAETFRENLFGDLNERAANGEFVVAPQS